MHPAGTGVPSPQKDMVPEAEKGPGPVTRLPLPEKDLVLEGGVPPQC